MSARMPVSSASTAAAVADGARPITNPSSALEGCDGGAEGGGLAGAGGADDEDERGGAGDGSGDVELGRVEAVGVDVRRGSPA